MIRKFLKSMTSSKIIPLNIYAKQPLIFLSVQKFSQPVKILNVWEVDTAQYLELTNAISGAHNCELIADILKSNLKILTDYHLSFAIYQLYNYDIELDEHFYNVIAPIIREYVKNFNREHNKSLAELIQHLGYLKVKDDSLWQLLEQKVIKERLYRYLSISQLVHTALGFAQAGVGQKDLWDTLERSIIKHRLSLDPALAEVAEEAFTIKKIGSNILYKILANPYQDIPELKQENKQIENQKH